MLHSLIKPLTILLWPHRVILAEAAWPSGKGLRPIKPLQVFGNANTEAILTHLADVIRTQHAWRPVKVVLLGSKTRYRLLAHHSTLSPDEFLALAQHQFGQIFGTKAAHWQCFTENIRPIRKNLILAVERDWLNSIQAILKASHLHFSHIQPGAVWALNSAQKQLRMNGWHVIRVDQEVFICKFIQSQLDYFKQITLSDSLTLEQSIHRALLSAGEGPETPYQLHSLFANTIEQSLVTQPSLAFPAGQ